MADVSNHYTSIENLETINKHIEAINDTISSNQTKILAKLSDMKAAMLVDGRKVSGNAFHQLPDRSIVHGTLLYDTDMEALEEAIRPPVEKLERHGVASVRQRVRNISDIVLHLDRPNEAMKSVEAMEEYLIGYFTDGEILLKTSDVEKIEKMALTFEQFDNQ